MGPGAAKVNYGAIMERRLEEIGDRTPRLLLHCCCAPCSSAVLERLDGRFLLDAFFDNPNISPREEHDARLAELIRLAGEMPLVRRPEVLSTGYAPETFLEAARGLEMEPEGGRRCEACFRLRLENAARRARDGGYEFFTTTLTISPLKDAALLNRIGLEMAERYGVRWLESDFKKKNGYTRSVELSRQYGLYRQNYCGCAFSRKPVTE